VTRDDHATRDGRIDGEIGPERRQRVRRLAAKVDVAGGAWYQGVTCGRTSSP
jgi:hypothetical protein